MRRVGLYSTFAAPCLSLEEAAAAAMKRGYAHSAVVYKPTVETCGLSQYWIRLGWGRGEVL